MTRGFGEDGVARSRTHEQRVATDEEIVHEIYTAIPFLEDRGIALVRAITGPGDLALLRSFGFSSGAVYIAEIPREALGSTPETPLSSRGTPLSEGITLLVQPTGESQFHLQWVLGTTPLAPTSLMSEESRGAFTQNEASHPQHTLTLSRWAALASHDQPLRAPNAVYERAAAGDTRIANAWNETVVTHIVQSSEMQDALGYVIQRVLGRDEEVIDSFLDVAQSPKRAREILEDLKQTSSFNERLQEAVDVLKQHQKRVEKDFISTHHLNYTHVSMGKDTAPSKATRRAGAAFQGLLTAASVLTAAGMGAQAVEEVRAHRAIEETHPVIDMTPDRAKLPPVRIASLAFSTPDISLPQAGDHLFASEEEVFENTSLATLPPDVQTYVYDQANIFQEALLDGEYSSEEISHMLTNTLTDIATAFTNDQELVQETIAFLTVPVVVDLIRRKRTMALVTVLILSSVALSACGGAPTVTEAAATQTREAPTQTTENTNWEGVLLRGMDGKILETGNKVEESEIYWGYVPGTDQVSTQVYQLESYAVFDQQTNALVNERAVVLRVIQPADTAGNPDALLAEFFLSNATEIDSGVTQYELVLRDGTITTNTLTVTRFEDGRVIVEIHVEDANGTADFILGQPPTPSDAGAPTKAPTESPASAGKVALKIIAATIEPDGGSFETPTPMSTQTVVPTETATAAPTETAVPPTETAVSVKEIPMVTDLASIEGAADGSTAEKRAEIARGILAGVANGTIPGIDKDISPLEPFKAPTPTGVEYSYFDFDTALYVKDQLPIRGITLVKSGNENTVYGVMLMKGKGGTYGLIWYEFDITTDGVLNIQIPGFFSKTTRTMPYKIDLDKKPEKYIAFCKESFASELCDAYLQEDVQAAQQAAADAFVESGGVVPSEMTLGQVVFLPLTLSDE